MASKKRRRTKPQPDDPLANLKRQARRAMANDQAQFILTPPGEAKMSDLLVALVEPYRRSATTLERFRTLLYLGLLAWNAALRPDPAQQQALIDQMLQLVPTTQSPATRDEARLLVQALVQRKQRLFAEYRRAIISLEVRQTGVDYQISVAFSEDEAPLPPTPPPAV